jgi:hypothetical protein
VAAPPSSKFRVAVHVFDQGSVSQGITPKLQIRLKGQDFGPWSPTVPLTGTGDVWVGAELDFDSSGAPSAKQLDLHLTPTTDPNPTATEYPTFEGVVGACQ